MRQDRGDDLQYIGNNGLWGAAFRCREMGAETGVTTVAIHHHPHKDSVLDQIGSIVKLSGFEGRFVIADVLYLVVLLQVV